MGGIFRDRGSTPNSGFIGLGGFDNTARNGYTRRVPGSIDPELAL